MSKLREKWQPKDIIALVVIVGCLVLKGLGHDSALSWTLIGIVGAYYGIDLAPFIKLGRNQNDKAGGVK